MSTENTPSIKTNSLMPTTEEFQMLQIIAKNAQDSGFYAGVGQQSRILMVLLSARELGISPMLALNGGIWNIQGKIEISARLMNGLIRRAGHSIKIVESTDTNCTLLGTRSDGDFFTCTFSQEDATKAGLWTRDVWKKYPADMLYNRCMSRLARRLFSDVIGVAYVEGEIREAKEIERLQVAEYEDLSRQNNQFHPDIQSNQLEPDISLPQHPPKEPSLSQENLEIFMKHYVNTNDIFKENFERHMFEKWGAKEYHEIPNKVFDACMTSLLRNIEMQGVQK